MAHASLDDLHAATCKVFTHPTRIRLLNALRKGPRSVTDLARAVNLPQPNVSQHLAVMRGAGVLGQRKEGTIVRYSVVSPKVHRAFDLMREVLEDRLREAGRLTEIKV